LAVNVVEVGYEIFSDPKEQGTIQGFNTLKEYLMPVDSVKKKYSIVAPVVTDDMELERLRRIDPKQDQSDRSDEEVFIIKCIRINASNEVDSADYDTEKMFIQTKQSDQTITLYGFYLFGQLDSASTITLTAGGFIGYTDEEFTITGVEYDKVNNRTILTVSESLVSGTNQTTSYSFHFDVDVFMPERIEVYTNISGLVDSYSVYNLDHSPTNILFEWWDFLGGMINEKAGAKKVKFTTRKNNVALEKRGSKYTGSDDISESQDFTLTALRGYNATYMNRKEYELKGVILNYDDEWNKLLLSLEGEEGTTDWGYVSCNDHDGNSVKFWPTQVEYQGNNKEAMIKGWGKKA